MTKRSEFTEQCAIIAWAEYQRGKYPQLAFLNASLNGLKLPIGLAVKAKRSGLVKGYPDLNLPWRNGTFSGLYIELKYGKNKASKDQLEFIEFLNGQGYYATVCVGADEAIDLIKAYLENQIEKDT